MVRPKGISAFAGLVMQIALFLVLWLVFWLGVPTIIHLLFGSSEYPLVSLSAVVSSRGRRSPRCLANGNP